MNASEMTNDERLFPKNEHKIIKRTEEVVG